MDSKNKKNYKKIGTCIWKFIKEKGWYSFLLLISSLYIWKYRFEINQFKELDAKNLIFILWIFLLVFPLFSELEILGVKVKKEVEKATEEVKESLKSIQSQITQLQLNNSVSNKISIENAPLPSEKRLEEMQKGVLNSPKKIPDFKIDESQKKALFLFEVRLEIEMSLREICEKIGHPGILASLKMLQVIKNEGLIDNKTEELILEVQKIANRGIHGEIVSDEYIAFVKNVYPGIKQQLNKISKNIEYIKCLNCGYSGYSKEGKICPKCGNNCSIDLR